MFNSRQTVERRFSDRNRKSGNAHAFDDSETSDYANKHQDRYKAKTRT